ncbi:MAG: thioredoxin family protein [Beijerinckiaceae bacterium]
MPRTRFFASLVFALSVVSASALAAVKAPFTQVAFEQALKSGDPILIEIHADWCPTCKAQDAVMGPLQAKPQFSKLRVFRVDFDSQKDVVKKFNARMQSTLIVFRGGAEVARSVGETEANSLEMLLDKAL